MLPEKIGLIIKNGGYHKRITPLVIRPEKNPIEYNIWGFDTEYDSETKKLVCWQLADKRGGVLLRKPLTLENIISETGGGHILLIVYFSLAELQFLPVFEKGSKYFVSSRGTFDVSFQVGKHTIDVFDVARFFDGQSLAAAASSLGYKKLEYDRAHVSKKDLKNRKFIEYAKNDAIITYGIFDTLRREFNGEGVDIVKYKTPAGVSAASFRLHVQKPIEPPPEMVQRLALEACWGGRTECYYRGCVPSTVEYDIKSSYPTSAAELGTMPVGGWKTTDSSRVIFNSDKMGFAKVEFTFPPHTRIPCLPVVYGGYQLFLLSGLSICTFDEIRQARAMGAKLNILQAAYAEEYTSDFVDYLKTRLVEREKAVGARKVALKLLCNSIIGKLAQCVHDINLEEARKLSKGLGLSLYEFFGLNPIEQEELGLRKKVALGPVFMPSWSALILGRARARLNEMLTHGIPIYSATDAVWYSGICVDNKKLTSLGASAKAQGVGILLRTRLAGIFNEAGTPEHLARHSVASNAAAIELLNKFAALPERRKSTPIFVKYKINRPLKPRESLRIGLPLGKWITETRTASGHWDNKRRLLPSGETLPWADVGEFSQFCEKV